MILIFDFWLFFEILDLRSLGLHEGDEGFEETIKSVNTALSRTRIPDPVNLILNDEKSAAPEV